MTTVVPAFHRPADTRRRFLLTAAAGTMLPGIAAASPIQVAVLIRRLVGDAQLDRGRVKLDLPVLVENGNTVAMTVSVDAPPGTVESLHVFAEANPQPEVLRLVFGPRSGVPRIQARIRLATSQTVVAIARMHDGTFWQDSVDLLVTLAACID
ncbi:MAG: thiosulfate oxidation carrier protein SoxY [Rhodospirillales bacterium]